MKLIPVQTVINIQGGVKMKGKLTRISIIMALLLISLVPLLALAQSSSDEDAAACAVCGGFGLMFMIILVVSLAISIALAFWVYNDAKSRGDNAVLWVIVVIAFNLMGLVVYLIARTKGDLADCPKCGKKKLSTAEFCPHCEGDMIQQQGH